MLLELPELINQYKSRDHRGDRIGYRHTDPDTQGSEETGKDDQTRDQEQHLPGNGQEDRFLRHTDRKEKVGRHHLEANDREDGKHDVQAKHSRFHQLVIRRKHMNDQGREQLAQQETGRSHPDSPLHSQLRYFRHTGI